MVRRIALIRVLECEHKRRAVDRRTVGPGRKNRLRRIHPRIRIVLPVADVHRDPAGALDRAAIQHQAAGCVEPVVLEIGRNDEAGTVIRYVGRYGPAEHQIFRASTAFIGAGAVGASLAKLLDTTGLGIVQLDGRGRIVAANDRARDLLRTGDGLYDEDGFLYARTPEDDGELQGLLTRALPAFGAQGAGGSATVRRPSAQPPLVLHVNPVGRQETDLRVWPVAALVLVADPASQTRIDPAVAAATLGLTGMESRVAVLLAEGMNVGEIAAATGRGESMIRSHVKHMFAKHGLSRQADLVRLVLSLAGAPEPRR